MEANKTDNKINKRLSLFGANTQELKALAVSENLPNDGLWAFASVEIQDTAGDVVKIAGISWDEYHNPPNSYLKIIAQHAMELANGEPPVVGRVERFVKTTTMVDGNSVPALAFYMTWAKDGEGTLTPLAKKYKDLYDGQYMDSFSVGLLTSDYEKNDAGLTYNTSTLYHIGAVTVPGNTRANVLRSLGEEIEGKIARLEKTINELDEIIAKQSEMIATATTKLDEMCKSHQTLVESQTGLTNDVRKSFEATQDRMDSLEAGVVVKSVVQQPQTDDRKRVEAKELSEVSVLLKKYSGR